MTSLPVLLVDDLAQSLLYAERLAAVWHHLRVEAQPAIVEACVHRVEYLLDALDPYEVARLQAKIHGGRWAADREPPRMQGKWHTAAQPLNRVVEPVKRGAQTHTR